jgi:polysaccharide biosynthesis transport protein
MKATQSALKVVPRAASNLQKRSPSEVVSFPQRSNTGSVPIIQPVQTIDIQPDEVTTSRFSPALRRQVAIVTGVAVAATAAGVAHVTTQAPDYEGQFHLSVNPIAPPADTINPPQIESTNEAIAIPTLTHKVFDYETQIRVLQSPRLMNPVVEQLQAQGLEIDYTQLTNRLEISRSGADLLKVTYRDSNPETVEAVLKQVSLAYLKYGRECKADACRGIEFIEAQLPKVEQQLQSLQTKLRQWRQQHGGLDSALAKQFSVRVNEVSQQGTEIQIKLTEAYRQLESQEKQTEIQANGSVAIAILDSSKSYQTTLQKLERVDSQIASKISRLQPKGAELQTLNQQHQTLLKELQQESQQALNEYLSRPESVDLVQFLQADPARLSYLQQSIDTAHHVQVFQVRQRTIGYVEELMQQEMNQLALRLRQQSDLERQLKTTAAIYDQYLAKLETLQKEAATSYDIAWQLVLPPQILTNEAGEPIKVFSQLPRDLAAGSVIGLLLSMSFSSAMQKRRRIKHLDLAKPASQSDSSQLRQSKRVAVLQALSKRSLAASADDYTIAINQPAQKAISTQSKEELQAEGDRKTRVRVTVWASS